MGSTVLQRATLAAAAAVSSDPPAGVVVFTGVALVFGILVILWLLLMLEGKIFEGLEKKKQAGKEKVAPAPAPAAPAAPAPAAPAAAPAPAEPAMTAQSLVIEEGIQPEVVAAIAAAVQTIDEGRYTLRRVEVSKRARGQWGQAGVVQATEPF